MKTQKQFYRPMNRAVQVHLKSIRPDEPQPDQPVFHCGSSRPNEQFQRLCSLADVKPKQDIETGEDKLWVLKDLRKTSATYYDEHMPESSIEILGHSVGGVTYRHYAHRDPLAFKAITSLPQPTAFNGARAWIRWRVSVLSSKIPPGLKSGRSGTSELTTEVSPPMEDR